METLKRYPLTYGIIFLNTLFFLLSALQSGNIVDIDLDTLVDLGALYGPLVVKQGEWWRLLSAMFLHGGMTHILMNMVSLYIIGRGMELYFPKAAYLAIYLLSGLVGGLLSLYMHPMSVGVGASGAIFGVFGALAGFFLAHRKRIGAYSREFMKDFVVILGLNLMLGLSISSIDMSAHIGGLVVGMLGGYMVAKYPRSLPFFVLFGIIIVIVGAQYLSLNYDQILR